MIPLLFLATAYAASISVTQVPWLGTLKKAGLEQINVCGTPDILPKPKALKTAAFVGGKAYVFADQLSFNEYWKILDDYPLEEAKTAFETRFKKVHLWEVSESGEVKDLGAPTRFEFRMQATVRDCVEGKRRTNFGPDCNRYPDPKGRASCCREKFIGPLAFWDSGFKLIYSPDPSTRLKVPGEKRHRFCEVTDPVKIRD
jgi:hypothetical protein